jgi:hypothetical protein
MDILHVVAQERASGVSRCVRAELCQYGWTMRSRSLHRLRYEKHTFWVILTFAMVIVSLMYVYGGK